MRYAPIAAVLLAVPLLARADATTRPAGAPVAVTDTAALEAAKDTEITVEGRVTKAAWSKSGKSAAIDFGEDAKFMAVVFEKSRPKFDEAFGGDFTKQFTGAVVRLTGKVAAYGGKAEKYNGYTQMILSQTGQVTVVTPATQPATQPAG